MRPLRLRLTVLLGVVLGLCAPARAIGPDNVAVVVNADSWASLSIANAFVAGRRIPDRNIIFLSDLPGYEQIGVEEFREKLLKPVLKAIEDRGLAERIDCIAWSADFPYAVDVTADVTAAKLTLPQVLTPVASLNGLTYLHELVLAKDPRYLDLNANWYYRKPIRSGTKPPAAGPMQITEAEVAKFRDAMAKVQAKKWAEATPILQELFTAHPQEPQLGYNLACSLAQEGKPKEAVAALSQAIEAGWFDRAHTEKDEDLKSLRDRDDYKAALEKITPPRFDVEPTIAFRRADRWNERGERVAEGGRRYLLSTMLAVTSGRGTSLDEALATLRSSMSAPTNDADVRRGTIYFVKNGDVRSRTREWAFAAAVEKLKSLKVNAEIVDGTLPMKKADVAGAVIGIADFDWPKSESRILPGAIVEHLTSFGGVLREHSGQTPLTAFMKHGAAGASGTVTEPYAIQAKFPSPFLHVHYASGATLAEAFYQSVQGPYQLLIVGDPLCAPWAKPSQAPSASSDANRTPADAIELRLERDGASSPNAAKFGPDELIRLRVHCDDAETIRLEIAGQPVAELPGGAGTTSIGIPAKAIGAGEVVAVAIARTKDGERHSRPLPLRIAESPAAARIFPARESVGEALIDGLLLKTSDRESIVVSDLRDANWLASLKLPAGTTFSLEGQFEQADVFGQFQTESNCQILVEVDGVSVPPVSGTRWQYRPFWAQRGSHHLVVRGTIPANGETPRLAVRYGGSGTQSLDGKRFRHPATR